MCVKRCLVSLFKRSLIQQSVWSVCDTDRVTSSVMTNKRVQSNATRERPIQTTLFNDMCTPASRHHLPISSAVRTCSASANAVVLQLQPSVWSSCPDRPPSTSSLSDRTVLKRVASTTTGVVRVCRRPI